MGGAESFLHNRCAEPEGDAGCGCRHMDVRRFLRVSPQLHILVSDPPKADFHENGMFSVSPAVNTKAMERIFRHRVNLWYLHTIRYISVLKIPEILDFNLRLIG